MNRIYVCSPLGAPTPAQIRENMLRAREFCAVTEMQFPHSRAYAPHAWLPELLNDGNDTDRSLALAFGIDLLKTCDALVVCGERVSRGMENEIAAACHIGIPVYALNAEPAALAAQLSSPTEILPIPKE